MNPPIPINIAVEDPLSEDVVRVLLHQSRRNYAIGTCYRQGGFGYLKRSIGGFNNAARGTPFLVLTDLDTTECPPVLIKAWLPRPKHHNLVFRVAVREVESWLLAHREALAKYLGIRAERIPPDVDAIDNPKRFLIDLARKSPRVDLRQDIVPPDGSSREQGPDYNGRLAEFVHKFWKAAVGQRRSVSLRRAVMELNRFQPE